MFDAINVLKKPLVTEKTSSLSSSNIYGFIVDLNANKRQVKLAVETLYDVRVICVSTSISAGKTFRTSKSIKKRSKIKKAYVKLADGQKIEFFKSV